jgi:hypothetical protein
VNQEPKPHQPDQFSFEKEPTPGASNEPEATEPKAEPVRSAVYPTPVAHERPSAPVAPVMKLDRTSGIAMYMLAVASGLVMLTGASYLISSVFRYFLVEKNNMFLYFDLSTIDLYFIVVTLLFGLVHFLAMGLVQKGSSNVGLGFRRRHEVVSAFWQTALALAILGSIVSLIYAPIENMIGESSSFSDTSDNGGELTASLLSSGFVLLFASILLWRDRMVAKGSNALIPTAIGALMLVGAVGASIAMMSMPKEEPETPSFESMTGGSSSSSTSDFNFETGTENDDMSSSSSSTNTWSFDSSSSSSDTTDPQQP